MPSGPSAQASDVQPGAIVKSKTGQCTFNFMFAGSDGRRYMGTAGHCILARNGEKSWAAGRGPIAKDAGDRRIGRFRYAILKEPKDFALIHLGKDIAATPQMCSYGGPTGINNDRSGTPTLLQFCGRGILLGDLSPGRTGIALSMADPDQVFMESVATPGDSGSGVTSADGRAVGVLVTVGAHFSGGLDAGVVGVTRLRPQLRRAENVLGMNFRLRRASLL